MSKLGSSIKSQSAEFINIFKTYICSIIVPSFKYILYTGFEI